MLSGELAVLQAPTFDGLSLDPLRLEDDGRCPAEVGVGGRHFVQALVAAPVIRLSNIFLLDGSEPKFVFYPGADFDSVIVDSHLEMLNRVYSWTSDCFAGSEIEAGAMMGTDDLAADLATAFQGEIKMRAAVLDRKHIVARAADEDGGTGQGICAMLAVGDFG